MSTATPATPKAPRSARRNQKRVEPTNKSTNTPQSGNPHSSFTPQTPPSSPPDSSSVEVPPGTTNNSGNGTSKKKNGRSAKKNKSAVKASPMPNGTSSHRHTSSQPSNVSPSGPKDNPKDNPHYAGPTFHASPAPSALPIPSFFSKSVPDSDHAESELDSDLPELRPSETTPSKPKSTVKTEEKIPEESPLDFLFKAAREARGGNGTDSPRSRPQRLSPPFSDKKPCWNDQSEGASGGVFPLELEGSDAHTPPIGPSFATPYKDRMNALRSASSPCRPPSDLELEEEQRKAKTEALKTLLLNPRPQRPATASPQPRDQQSMFTPGNPASPSRPQNNLARHTPLSPTQAPTNGSDGNSRGIFDSRGTNNAAHQYLNSVCNNPQKPRAPSSNLRQEVSLSNPTSHWDLTSSKSMGSVRAPSTQANFSRNPTSSVERPSPTPWKSASTTSDPSLTHQFSPSPKSVDTTRMEDDLRRILKLDITSGINSNGVQSPVA